MTETEQKALALVERLRDDLPQTLIEKHWVDDNDAIYKQREEAADLIETQAREIERLREALGNVLDALHVLGGDPEDRRKALKDVSDALEEARAALEGKQ